VALVNQASGTFAGGFSAPYTVSITLPFTPTDGNLLWLNVMTDTTSGVPDVATVYCGTQLIPWRVIRNTGSGVEGKLIVFLVAGATGTSTSLSWNMNTSGIDGCWHFAEYSNLTALDGANENDYDRSLVARDTTVLSDPKAVTAGSLILGVVGLGRFNADFTPTPAEGWNEIVDVRGVSRTGIWAGDRVASSTGNIELTGTLDTESPWSLSIDAYTQSVATVEVTADADVMVVDQVTISADIGLFVSDAPAITVEPDRPKLPGLAVPTLIQTTDSTVTSPTVDFEAQGVGPGDVLEILSGANRGHYIVRAVAANTLAVQQAFLVLDPTPVAAEVRVQRNTTAYRTAAVVVSQPSYNQGFSLSTGLDLLLG
jgi:hypothetical protein